MNLEAQDLFTRALELPESEREAFIARECGDDAELRLEVERLLIDAERADAFFGDEADNATIASDGSGKTSGRKATRSPATPTTSPVAEPIAEKEGDLIGPYKLLQEIGEGGFGSVWMAEQSEPIHRKVALKVIKMGMDTREVIARFESERQALAMMDHPNIAKVLDAGATDRGRPYFVMELVRGVPITEYCDELALGTRERLTHFRDVCSAINHAHQKGIIHRDIKPSNVLVMLQGDHAVVKVIDFGIAKATQGKLTDKTLFTRFEQFVGTPVYMSPEQAALKSLDIDTRSDIYALGVLLYELLVGKPPFDAKTLVSAGYDEMRRIIREVEPPKPSSRLSTVQGEERTQLAKTHKIEEAKLNRLVEPDLDWIVMKAIDKDRTRRYETANAFAADLRRFLEDEAITARPPSKGYQFRKFARRHKGAFRIAALIALLLVAATLVSGWQAVRATKAEALATDRLVESEKARAEAEAISGFLTGMFESSRPGEEKGGREVKVADVLDLAAKKLDTDLADQPERRAQLQATLGKTYFALGLYPQAIALQEQVRDFHLKTFGAEHRETVKAMNLLAASHHEAGHRDEAIRIREEALALSRKVNGPEHPDTLRAMSGLALSYHAARRRDEALKMREEALALFRKVLGPEHPGTLNAMLSLTLSYEVTGNQDMALKLREEALVLSRKVNGPEHPDTLRAMKLLATSYGFANRREEAYKLREEALVLSRKVLGPEHPDTLTAMGNLGQSYSGLGRRDEAIKMQEEVLALRRKVNGPEHPSTLTTMNILAGLLTSADRHDEVLKLKEEALALSHKINGPEHPDTLTAMGNLASYYRETGRRDEALKMFEELLDLRRKALGPEDPETVKVAKIVENYHRQGELEEALAKSRKENGPEHPKTLTALEQLAISYEDTGRKSDSLKLREELVALLRKVKGPEDEGLLWNMHLVAQGQKEAGRLDEAQKLREEALALARKIHGPENPFTLRNMTKLAEIHEAAGRKDEAAKLRAEVEELTAKSGGASQQPNTTPKPATSSQPADALPDLGRQALAHRDAGRYAEAVKAGEELLAQRRKALGQEHKDTLSAIYNLGISLRMAGRTEESVQMLQDCVELRRKVLGPEDPTTLTTMQQLAESYKAANREEDAANVRAEIEALKAKE